MAECEDSYFREGTLICFKTLSTAGDYYKFALAVRIDDDYDLSFVDFEGRSWGYGRCTLPEEARFQGRRYTVDKAWLENNMEAIVEPEDLGDVWVCKDAQALILKCVTGKAGYSKSFEM